MRIVAVTELVWGHSTLRLVFAYDERSPLRLCGIGNGSDIDRDIPIGPAVVEILTAEDGRTPSSSRLVRTTVGDRLRYVNHEVAENGNRTELRISLVDPKSRLEATLTLVSWEGISGFRSTVRVRDASSAGGQVLLAAPSWSSGLGVALGDSGSIGTPVPATDLIRGSSDWLAEGRWERVGVREHLLPNMALEGHGQNARGKYSEVSTGTWSTGVNLPVAALEAVDAGLCWGWQIEHNGPWRWEIGEDIGSSYLSLSGPTDVDHQWNRILAGGESFDSVPVSLVIAADLDGAVAQLTRLRRASRRPHPDQASMGVIFNDYMNTLMGDPTTEKLLPLVDAAAGVGAEIFCIDAGWYDDDGDWWDGVGAWLPSTVRFPGGLGEVIDRIRSAGMVPGLWLEPEVVGVRSPVAAALPDSAFLRRGGRRILEHGRYHLNLTDPAALAHLDGVVDRLVAEFGIGYFKLDYNIDPGAGTDAPGRSVGDALLSHNLAYLAWLDGVLDRHPGLILENCSSGAMRMDFALLSRLQLQSTSDQQDYLKYPPIAASAPLAMLPEQAASWAYPQPGMTEEQIAFCLCTAMLGRYFLSGYLNRMSAPQLALVTEAVAAHKAIREEIRGAVPVWPLGLPGWDSPWIAMGLRQPLGDESILLTIWSRTRGDCETVLELPSLRGRALLQVDVIFPRALAPWEFSWDPLSGRLSVRADPGEPGAARTIRIRPQRDAAGAEIAEVGAGPSGPTQ
jgi:alpha-galactosidase